jgi:hypothetical protein
MTTLAHKRRTLFKRQNGICYYCKCEMTQEGNLGKNSKRVTLEHLQPRSKGGSDRMENLVAACAGCNNKRGNGEVRNSIVADAHKTKSIIIYPFSIIPHLHTQGFKTKQLRKDNKSFRKYMRSIENYTWRAYT